MGTRNRGMGVTVVKSAHAHPQHTRPHMRVQGWGRQSPWSTWRAGGALRSHSQLTPVSIPRAALQEFLRTLCQWRNLPEPISGPQRLPVSVSGRAESGRESGREEREKVKEMQVN